MPPHKYTYPKVVATRPGPSAYERRTKVHEPAPRDQHGDQQPERPRSRRRPQPR